MTDKPQPKKEISIDWAGKNTHLIYFYASVDAMEDMQEFGTIERWGNHNQYRLEVDKRYDFDEVVKYIQEYN